MRVGFSNIAYTPNFTSRREDVRRADDIQRKTRQTFPMVSTTYIEDNFKTSDTEKGIRVLEKTGSDIKNMRHSALDIEDDRVSCRKEAPFKNLLNAIAKNKKGNCYENAIAALAVLCANEYCNSRRMILYAAYDFINKETSEIEATHFHPLNHTFAMTDMNKGEGRDIVVDPWLGFADTEQGAIERFKQVYSENDFKKGLEHAKIFFELKKKDKNEEFNLDDYDIKTTMKIMIAPDGVTEPRYYILGDWARDNFEGIVLDAENE